MSSQTSAAAFFITSSEQSALQWFELIFFALSIPPLALTFIIHRRIPGGRFGWFLLWNFALLRTVGFALLKGAHTKNVYIAGTVISGASLSPLFFATAGIWYEVALWHQHLSPTLYAHKTQVVLHVLVAGAIAMVIAGAATQLSSATTPSYSRPLQIVGTVLLLVIWAGLCLMLAKLWSVPKSAMERRLLIAVGLVLPLLGVRTLYSLLGAAIDSVTWSYYKAPIAAEVVMQVVPDCLILIIYAIAGLATRELAQERNVAPEERKGSQSSRYVGRRARGKMSSSV